MAKRRKVDLSSPEQATFELDLTPVLALMCTLTPLLLVSTQMVKTAVIESALPQAVANAIENDRQKTNRDVLIKLKMEKATGLFLSVLEDQKPVYQVTLAYKDGRWDLPGLQKELVRVKQTHPEVFRLDFAPEPGVSYEEIVKVVDEARVIRDPASRVSVKDPKSGDLVVTDVLYPDVVFANVLGE